MKAKLLGILLAILMVVSVFALIACEWLDPVDPPTDENEEAHKAIYELYVDYAKNNGQTPDSYEDWLDSIRGENGKDGKPGKDGKDGKDGVSPSIGENGNWWIGDLDTGVPALPESGKDGQDGKDGIGIAKIEKISSEDLVDTYEITYTTGTKFTFIITNGANGADGEDGEDLTACAHEFGIWSTLVEATCTSVGIEARACTKCLYAEHNYTKKLDHTYNSTIVDPTCSTKGFTKHICSTCNHTYYDAETNTIAHNYVESHTLESNCEERKVLSICSNCGISTVTSEEPIIDHAFGEWIIDIEATCTTDGEKHRVCQNNDSHIDTQVILATGHVIMTIEGKAPTCLKKGYTEGRYCAACGEILVEQEPITKLGHEFTAWYVVTPSTEDTNGEKRRNCIRCDEFETAEIPMLGHSYILVEVVEPTCNEYGYSLFKCNDCEDTYKDNFVAKIPHNITDTIIDPTCTEDGYTTHVCSECGYSYITDYVVAIGHVYGDWSVSLPAGCETDGEDVATCCYCEATTTRSVTATGHLYVLIEVAEGDTISYTYQCEYCEDTIVMDNDDDVHIETDEQIFDRENNFSFVIITEESVEYIYSHLTIIDAYFEGTEHVDNENVVQEYDVTASNTVENGWIISPKTPYEGGYTYIATISGNIEFADYNAIKLTFSIVDDIHSEATVSSNVKFLKDLEDSNPGYYPYEIYEIEESDYLYLILQKIDGIDVGDILLIGEVTNTEEIFSSGEEILFGKVESYYMNDDSEYVCVLSCPELTEVFDKLDISDESLINFEEHPEAKEVLEEQSLAYLYDSEEFAKFIVATEQATMSYAMDRNLRVSPLSRETFADKIKIEKPDINIDGTKITFKFSGSFKNEFKNKNDKKIGEFSIDFTITMELEIKVGVKYKIKYKWFVPTGMEYFDISITQRDKIAIDFSIKFEVDYSSEEEKAEGRYYYHEISKKLHVVGCNYEEMTNNSNIVYINETQLHEYKKDSEFSECQKCKPITHLNRSAFVVNTHTTNGNTNIYTIHCYNCWHVENQMKPENMKFFYGSYELLVGKYKLTGQKYECCSWCKPQNKETMDFEESLLQTYKYADWGEKVSQIKEWAAAAGGDEYKDPEGIVICKLKYPVSIVTFNLEIRISFNFEFEAALNYHYEQTHENVYGMRLKNGKVKPYSETTKSESESTLKMSGSMEFQAGLRIDGYVSVVGLSKWIRAGMYIEAGPYLEAKGIVYLTSNPDEQNYAAAYFSTGFYVKSDCYYKIFKIKGDKTILDKKFPMSQLGYDKAYFSYTKDIDQLEISENTDLDLDTLLAVKYYDIHEGASKEDVLSLSSELYEVNIYLKNGEHCSIVGGKIIIDADAPCSFTDSIIIKVKGDTTWKKYVKGSAVFYLDTREIELVYNGDGSHSFKVVDYKDATCTESGYITSYCDICHMSKTETINPSHDTITDERVEPTCTTTGLTKGLHCSTCNEVLIEQSVIDVIDHDYENYFCKYCGLKYYSEGLEFTSNGDGTCYISGIGTCTDVDIVIPETSPNGEPVVAIGDFYNNVFENSDIVRIVIPDTVTYINMFAFSSCKNLEEVILGSGTQTIDEMAFLGCSALKTIYIPAKASVQGRAFDGCTSLESILVDDEHPYYSSINGNLYNKNGTTLIQYALGKKDETFIVPDGVTYIRHYALSSAQNVKTIILGDTVTTIGTAAFRRCSSLESIIIPRSVNSIGVYFIDFAMSGSEHILADCKNLKGIYYEGTEGDWNEITIQEEWCNNDPFKTALYYYPEAQPTTVGNFWHWVDGEPTVWEIHIHTEKTIPAVNPTCTETGLTEGTKCSDCGDILVAQNIVSALGHNYDNGVCTICGEADPDYASPCSQGLEYTLNEDGQSYSVTGIGTCTDTDIIFPSTYNNLPVTRIGLNNSYESIFGYTWVDKTISITIPDSVIEICNHAFYGGLRFSTINLGNGVQTIGEYAFWGSYCDEIFIPASVTNIKSLAFHEFWNMKKYVVDENNNYYKSIDGNLYSKDGKTLIVYAIDKEGTSFTIPEHVTTIESFAFCSNRYLESVCVPVSVTRIGMEAFSRGSIQYLFYAGNQDECNRIEVDLYNDFEDILFYYSETAPTEEGNFWHWVDGEPTVWE